MKGTCMSGICNCKPGHFGEDCSITTCTSLEFVASTGSTCVSSCASTEYGNTYNRLCMACHATCLACSKGGIYGCSTCPNGKFKTAVNSCVSTCPDGYYPNVNVCTQCNAACKTCSASGTSSCLSCPTGKWL